MIQDHDRAKRKEANKHAKLLAVVDKMGKEIDEIIGFVEDETNAEIHKNIRRKCEAIVEARPLSSIKQIHKDYYTFISKLGKTIDKAFPAEVNGVTFDIKSVQSLVKKYVTDCSRLNAQSPDASDKLLALLETNEIEKALAAIEPDSVEQSVYRGLLQLRAVSHFRGGEYSQAVGLLASRYPKSHTEELGRFLHRWTYLPEQDVPAKLRDHDSEAIRLRLAQSLQRSRRKRLGLEERCVLGEVCTAGMLVLPSLLRNAELVAEAEDEKEFEVPFSLPRDMIHHSVIYCPVSKEVCHPSRNKAVLLSCGHILGQASAQKMMESSRNLLEARELKCPTCPNTQKPESFKSVVY